MPQVLFLFCDLFKETLSKHIKEPGVESTYKSFLEFKAENPLSKFGHSDYPYSHSYFKGKLHAKLTRDISIIYTLSGGDTKIFKLYGIFSHDESGTGTPSNLNRQKGLSTKMSNQNFY